MKAGMGYAVGSLFCFSVIWSKICCDLISSRSNDSSIFEEGNEDVARLFFSTTRDSLLFNRGIEERNISSNETNEASETNTGDLKLRIVECEEEKDCRNIDGSFCDSSAGICACKVNYPITDSFDCYKESKIGEFCHYDIQCYRKDSHATCDSTLHICQCLPRYQLRVSSKEGRCVEKESDVNVKMGSYVDPALFGIMGGLVLMFIIICVVLQLFAKAQFRENRTIFNTPNPRLMNVSLMKDRNPGNAGGCSSSGRRRSYNEENAYKNSNEMAANVTVESVA